MTEMEYAREHQDFDEASELSGCRICGDYAKVTSETVLVGMEDNIGYYAQIILKGVDRTVDRSTDINADVASLRINMVNSPLLGSSVDIVLPYIGRTQEGHLVRERSLHGLHATGPL